MPGRRSDNDKTTETEPQPGIQGQSIGGFEGRQECKRIEKRPVDGFPRNTSELATQFDVHPNQIKQWRDQLLDGVTDVFDDRPKATREPEIDVKSLHAEIGQLTADLENDFLGLKKDRGPSGAA